MAKSNSSRGTRRRGRSNGNDSKVGSTNAPESDSQGTSGDLAAGSAAVTALYEAMDQLSDSLAIIETAYRALEVVVENHSSGAPETLTLGVGLKQIQDAYTQLDEAIREIEQTASARA